MIKLDKRRRAELFRERLQQAQEQTGHSRASLAREVGVDRSTLSQLLAPGSTRLPNAQVVGECATALGVSADWLLGLTERPERAADIVASALSMPEAPRALIDQRIFDWHQETEGYKIRHVPANLPDMLKTEAMLRWEYSPSLGRTIDQAIGASNDRLAWMRASASDYEIALPRHEIESFAHGEGYYHGLDSATRRHQLSHLIDLTTQLFPRLRLSLFDSRRLFSAPVTIFGPRLAAIYLGRNYLVFRDTPRIGAITEHFDRLVREADLGEREIVAFLTDLRVRAGL